MHKRIGLASAYKVTIALLALSLFLAIKASSQNALDPLKSGFENPPDRAKPLVWWQWMNGNISKEGIKLDLEWMRRAGLEWLFRLLRQPWRLRRQLALPAFVWLVLKERLQRAGVRY